ncbi:Phox-like protein [Coniophora puteana RWD-64-598 SS2]|uniref:Endosomal/vacuolar adapter protein YPT35 n=1 Tax=Coniophora puteana (strain RWD-64-598) TaxID=741705 RepID=A0A5M3MHZ9_CONPW|nr:Phox-like protein [Coniophora puteana RWD-64-598 SS2]EIW78868.1 Phox-like protein [Coniophora puteana RWD-64-598 SS2]
MPSPNTHVPASPPPVHPFSNSKGLLVVIPDRIDIEEEARMYEDLTEDPGQPSWQPTPKSPSVNGAPSMFSNDIWLGDNIGESLAFARKVEISGWTSVGDKLGGAYVVYDCVIKTKEGTTIHAHKRYSAFEQLYLALRRYLPNHQQHFIPPLPPKSPFAKYRPAFLDQRRRQLQYWLSSILLHPEIGGSQPVRYWVMD